MSYLVYEQKTGSDGKVHDQLVVDNAAAPADPNAARDKLVKQIMHTELEDLIATCQSIGSTNANGDGSQGVGSSPDPDLGDSDPTSAINAAKNAVAAAQKAEHAAQQAADAADAAVNKAIGNDPKVQAAQKTLAADKQALAAAQASLAKLKSELADYQKQLAAAEQKVKDTPEWVHGVLNPDWVAAVGQVYKIDQEITQTTTAINQAAPMISALTQKVNDDQTALNNAQAAAVNDPSVKQAQAADDAAHRKLEDAQQVLKDAQSKLNKLLAQQSERNKAKEMHNIIWNHNVFWALLHVAMAGNSSVFNVLTSALGKIANEMSANQGVTDVITDINNDLQELVNFPKNPTPADRAREKELVEDLQKQLLKLYYIINPNAAATTQEEQDMKKAVAGLGAGLSGDLKGEADQLFRDYKTEFNTDTDGADANDPTGLQKMLNQINGQELPGGQSNGYYSFDRFLNNMVNRDGKGAPSASTNAIYSHTSGLITSLNTAGSQFMAQQNLQTKQIDEIEKLWTSGISTDKSAIQTVTGNIAN